MDDFHFAWLSRHAAPAAPAAHAASELHVLLPQVCVTQRHPTSASVFKPQSTLRSRPQTSSAFFLPLVSGTYHERKVKKNTESAAKIR